VILKVRIWRGRKLKFGKIGRPETALSIWVTKSWFCCHSGVTVASLFFRPLPHSENDCSSGLHYRHTGTQEEKTDGCHDNMLKPYFTRYDRGGEVGGNWQ
jgi:hypothetical protein